MKYILIALILIGCTKPKTTTQDLLEGKQWYLYKEVTATETVNHSRQYWLKFDRGNFTDYDKYPGTYQINKDAIRIYFFNYGYETYYIEQIDARYLTLNQRTTKGIIYRRLYFTNK
jgi:hypothetical protein